jgi:hypothetical protein
VTDYGRETITVIELDVPQCQLEYGTTNAFGTCQASLTPVGSPPIATGDHKCFNTRVTCQDADNYNPATQIIRFAHPQRGLSQNYDNVFPSLSGPVQTTPGAINLGGMDRSLSALGARETVQMTLEDHQWNDHLFDKYRLERISGAAQAPAGSPPVSETYNPLERGSFWGKFIARNPYHSNYRARVKQGFMGQALDDMMTRSYIVDRITGPTNGKVQMVLKDLFSLIEVRKSVAPFASQGELSANITGTPASFTLLPVGIGSLTEEEGGYASITAVASGFVAIGDEVIEVTRSADVFTVVTRAALNTEQSDHDSEDLVQFVLTFDSELAHDIIYTLLTGYAEILPAEIPKATWDILAATMDELYTARITQPTAVRDLIGELCEQAGCTVWPDPETGLIEFRPLRPTASSTVVNDRDWIVDGSLEMKRQDAKRVSRCLVYYGQKNPTVDLEDVRNFRSRVITPDLDAESSTQYGVPAIKVVTSRWIPQFSRQVAAGVGSRIVALFRDPPLEASFRIHMSRDGELALAQPFLLQTFEAQDDTGAEDQILMEPVEISRDENEIYLKAQGVTFFTETDDSGIRTIFLDTPDMFNLNLRTIHDQIYQPPVGGEVVNVILVSGFTVGSETTALPAMRTGSWPAGVTLSLVTLGGRIQGRGGDPGLYTGTGPLYQDAGAGGDAILAEVPISIDNTGGEIFSGGGGGGVSITTGPTFIFAGGGGAGTDPGSAGQSYDGIIVTNGAPGTADAGGLGGVSVFDSAQHGGDGGGPGIAGGTGTVAGENRAGGATGNYITGNSFVTWVGTGDRRGGVA